MDPNLVCRRFDEQLVFQNNMLSVSQVRQWWSSKLRKLLTSRTSLATAYRVIQRVAARYDLQRVDSTEEWVDAQAAWIPGVADSSQRSDTPVASKVINFHKIMNETYASLVLPPLRDATPDLFPIEILAEKELLGILAMRKGYFGIDRFIDLSTAFNLPINTHATFHRPITTFRFCIRLLGRAI